MYGEAIIVFIVFASLTTIAIIFGLLVYFGKRLEHKQILAAIEKGTPLSELKPPKKQQNGSLWIRNLTFGIAMLIIGIALTLVGPHTIGSPGGHFLAFVFFAIGVAWIIRGLLFRKYQEKSRLSANGNTAEYNSAMSASAPEISKQPNE
jgi:sterol desaturase/sphingolipid hydroxylase (fatty acid hydroxylase superfamily)